MLNCDHKEKNILVPVQSFLRSLYKTGLGGESAVPGEEADTARSEENLKRKDYKPLCHILLRNLSRGKVTNR